MIPSTINNHKATDIDLSAAFFNVWDLRDSVGQLPRRKNLVFISISRRCGTVGLIFEIYCIYMRKCTWIYIHIFHIYRVYIVSHKSHSPTYQYSSHFWQPPSPTPVPHNENGCHCLSHILLDIINHLML